VCVVGTAARRYLSDDVLLFVVTRFLMKLFRSSNIDIINDCRLYFNFPLPSEIIEKRREKFLCKFKHCDSIIRHFGICGLCGI